MDGQKVKKLATDTLSGSIILQTSATDPEFNANGIYTALEINASKKETAVVADVTDNRVTILNANLNNNLKLKAGDMLRFRYKQDIIDLEVAQDVTDDNVVIVSSNTYNANRSLKWYNCISFGNGVESNRIGDTFNRVQMDRGARVSTTLEQTYKEERRKYGLIYSGLYNSTSGVNNLNPVYGSIQKLHTRQANLVALCEDRILRIYANKDALFNADGNMNLTATERVLGTAEPFAGEYGISKNPESFASESYRAYFADKQRGAILRLSRDGLTPISDYGMKDWFNDNLRDSSKIIGSYDSRKKNYNLTII